MSEILLNPNMLLTDAHSVAVAQGCCLIAKNGRVRLIKVKTHADASHQAAMKGEYAVAQQHLNAARGALEALPCAA